MAVRYYEVPKSFKEWREFAFYSLDDCQRIFKVNQKLGIRKDKAASSGFYLPATFCRPARFFGFRALRYAMQALDIMKTGV
jgi:hypothetical protein